MRLAIYGGIALLCAMFRGLLKKHPDAGIMRVGLLCVSWLSMSVGVHVLNKLLASTLRTPALITLVQMVVAALAMIPTSFHKLVVVPPSQMRTWLLCMPLLTAGIMCSSVYTLGHIPLSMFAIVHNLTPLAIVPAERALLPEGQRAQVSGMVLVSFLLVIGGAAIYGNGLELSVIALTFAGVNVTLAAGCRVIQHRLLTEDCRDMSPEACVLLSNTWGVIPTMALAIGTQEYAWATGDGNARWSDPHVLLLLLVSGIIALGSNYLSFEIQDSISARSFDVLQNVTKLAVVGMGVFMFDDPLTATTATGVILSMSGSAIYGHTQRRLSEEMVPECEAIVKNEGFDDAFTASVSRAAKIV